MKMVEVDFRIGDISSKSQLRAQYNKFVDDNKERDALGKKNEFEPQALYIQEIERELNFNLNSLMIIFFPYYDPAKADRQSTSNLSVHAMSIDYHKICKEYLMKMKQQFDDLKINTYLQCDIGYFNERFFAIQTGLCMEAVNAMAIHEAYGSYGFLGIFATDLRIKPYLSAKKKCSNCMLCISNCPSGAISKQNFDSSRCLSYLTQKKILTQEEEHLLHNHSQIYGCDQCQQVCPENFDVKYTKIKDFNENLLYNIRLEEIVSMSNRNFKKNYGDRNFSWRGKNIILRNLKLIEKEKYE